MSITHLNNYPKNVLKVHSHISIDITEYLKLIIVNMTLASIQKRKCRKEYNIQKKIANTDPADNE